MNSLKYLFIIGNLLFSIMILSLSGMMNAQTCQGHTLTQGGWGASNTSNPNVSYLYANFNNAFPSGLTIGCVGGNTLTLTTPQAITDFLPSGSTASPLNNSYTDPGGSYNNVLAGQMVSVMLAVGFDSYDGNFSTATPELGNFIFNSGPFTGMTVNQFLVLANNFIGGCGSSMYSAADFNAAATAINENYDEGNIDGGYLSCCKLQIHVSYEPIKCFGETTIVHVTATDGSSSTTGTGDFVVGAGTHTYTITDGNCSSSQTIVISQPEKLIVNIDYTPIKCNGGSSVITVSASGGTAPYTRTGTFNVSAGTYTYTVTDVNGCSESQTITINQPEALVLSINKGDVICVGGTATVSADVTGGTPPYTYLWSNGATTQTVELPVGNHSVMVTDANGCEISTSFEVKILSCAGFTTVTQGGWGAKAAGNNWGKYRDLNFASAFPSGLTIGAGSRFLKLTTAKAVDDFLPSGTTPRPLDAGTMVNPGGNYKNVFAGQVVALTLNLKFDQVDPTFSTSATWLGDLVVISGPFEGWTVNQILIEANNVLGGLTSSYTAEQMNSIVDAINNNYDNGTTNLGLLTCPCVDKSSRFTQAKPTKATINTQIKVYPNPTKGDINLKFEMLNNDELTILLYDATGRVVANLDKNISRTGNSVIVNYQNYNLAEGLYILRVKSPTYENTFKIMVKK